VYSGTNLAKVLDFFGIDDPNLRGGVRPAVGDVNGDKVPDLVIAAGYGGGPRVMIWDRESLHAETPTATASFLAFEPTPRNGAYVAAGDLDGDGFADLILAGGPGGGPRVLVVGGKVLTTAGADAAFAAPLANFFAGDPADRAEFWDTDGDGQGELVAGSGPDETQLRLWAYDSPAVLSPSGTAPQDLTSLMEDHLLSAVFVG
jgi:hypothetical protein